MLDSLLLANINGTKAEGWFECKTSAKLKYHRLKSKTKHFSQL